MKNIGVDTNLACALKFMDLNTLIDFGIFQIDKKKEHAYFMKKKEKDLPLTVENADFKAEEPDPDYHWGNYSRQVEVGVEDEGGRLYLKALKYTPVSEFVYSMGWARAGPDAKPCNWTLPVEQGCDLKSRMGELALDNKPAGREISIPASKGRRIHDDLETQTADGPKVHVLDIAQHNTFDGVLYIQKA